jgi:hypothetical protein
LESAVEDFSSFLEYMLDVKLTSHVKSLVTAALMKAAMTNNVPFIQYVNNCRASLPQMQSWTEAVLWQWRAQFQPQFLSSIQNQRNEDPMFQALLDLYYTARSASSSQSYKTHNKRKTEKKSDDEFYNENEEDSTEAGADDYGIEGIWSNKGRSAPLTSGISGFFQSNEVYEFKNDNTFRKTYSNKSVTYGDSKTVVTGHYKVEGNIIRMSSSDFGERVFMFSISNFGKNLALKGLDDNSVSFSGTYQRE